VTPNEERIQTARQKMSAGDFKRRVTGRKAVQLYRDELTLECGHVTTSPWLGSQRYALEGTVNCVDCAYKWLGDGAGGEAV